VTDTTDCGRRAFKKLLLMTTEARFVFRVIGYVRKSRLGITNFLPVFGREGMTLAAFHLMCLGGVVEG
jgi:hypothetical protein